MKEKSQVEDIDRSIYDFKDDEKDAYRIKAGLTPEIVQKLSKEKHDPAWMELFRLHSLQIYNEMAVPDWGPSIEGLNMDQIVTYVRPNTKMKAKWSDVPEDIKNIKFEARIDDKSMLEVMDRDYRDYLDDGWETHEDIRDKLIEKFTTGFYCGDNDKVTAYAEFLMKHYKD